SIMNRHSAGTHAHLPFTPLRQSGVRWRALAGVGLSCLFLAACSPSGAHAPQPSKGHFLRATNPPPSAYAPRKITQDDPRQNHQMPEGVSNSEEVYTITVTDMSVRDLLFALARDANMNVDIYPGVDGKVTLSAIDQPLPRILDRIAKQVNLRYEIEGQAIIIAPDKPYLKIYQVDYVNLSRTSNSTNRISSQISGDSSNADGETTGNDKNQSQSSLSTSSENHFWTTLRSNVLAILNLEQSGGSGDVQGGAPLEGGGASALPPGDTSAAAMGAGGPKAPGMNDSMQGNRSRESQARIVAMNQEAGLVSIFANASQHKRIKKLLNAVLDNVHRQVLIESTVVEVSLNDAFQGGVDWENLTIAPGKMLRASSNGLAAAFGLSGGLPVYTLPFSASLGNNATSSISATVRALQSFGTTKVLSSPKIMALNNQTSILKVVQNRVYFTVETVATSTSDTTNPVNTKLHTVPVGLVMSVTPQISSDDIVTLNVRPTISSISRLVDDPNPNLAAANTTNQIPEIQVKEMESLLRIHSGQVAVMGGLMQDKISDTEAGLPVLSDLPGIGGMFKFKDRSTTKTELVIFIRPVVMSHGSPKKPRTHRVNNRRRGQPRMGKYGAPPPAPGQYQQPPTSYLDFTNPGVAPIAPAPSAQPPMAQHQPNYGQAPQAPQQQQQGQSQQQGYNQQQGYGQQQAPQGTPPGYGQQQQSAYPPPSSPHLGQGGPQAGYAPNRGQHQPAQAPGPQAGYQNGKPMRVAYTPPTQGGQGGDFFVNLGSYLETDRANQVYQTITDSGLRLPLYRESAKVQGRNYLRVRAGPFQRREDAEQMGQKIAYHTGIQTRIETY
ncbi:MAG: pilus (MSHA type) biogenesis protein MshL, partial [Magnetococcales bacterium]|nr:pilus (MSHA type) biogenesis protein MshL [Magnetococcales bacterium]